MNINTEQTETQVVETVDTTVTPEMNSETVKLTAEMRRDALTQLVSIHLQTLTKVMLATNGVTHLQKRQANKALVEAVEFAINFGIKDDNTIRDKGAAFAKEANNLAAIMVQALDNRMILLANKFKEEDEKLNTENKETVNE